MSEKYSALCIDIGTTSLKGAVIKEDGSVVAKTRVHYERQNKVSQEWIRALKAAVSKMKREVATVSFVSISGNGPTIAGENGEVLLWNEKTKEAQCGSSPSFFIPRIKEFLRRYKDTLKEGESLFSPPEYLAYYLTGKKAAVIPNEEYIPYYWTKEALRDEGISPALLPPFLPITSFIGKVGEKRADDTGIPASSCVVSAGADFMAAMIGSASFTEGDIFHRAGSSEGFNLALPSKIKRDDLRILPSCFPSLWNAGAVNAEGSGEFEKFKKETEKLEGRKISYMELVEMAAFDKASEAARIMRKILRSEKEALDTLLSIRDENAKTKLKGITVTGGQAENEPWMQKKASFLKIPLAVMQLKDGELLGDAAVAFSAAGIYRTLKEAVCAVSHKNRVYFPEEEKEKPIEIYRIPEKLSAIIFDIDSTLYTNEEYAVEQLDVQIREFARTRGTDEKETRNKVALFRYNHYKKTGEKLSLANTLLHFGVSIEESIEMRRTLLEPSRYLKADKKLEETLSFLASRFTLLAVTNNPSLPARKTLIALGVEKYFSSLITLDTFRVSKPDKRPFLAALEKAKVSAEETLCVGDRFDIDIKTPLEMGMGGALVHSVKNVYSLKELFKRLALCR